MALGNAPRLNEIICFSCMDQIDWEATSEALGKVVTRDSYIESPNLSESLQFIGKGTLTRFVLKRPPAALVDKARELKDGAPSQAFFLGLRCIEKVEFFHDDEPDFPLTRTGCLRSERVTLKRKDAEQWNRILDEKSQDDLGPNVIAEMGLVLLDLFEGKEDENF